MSGERVLVLADDRPGNVAQALGVAEALDLPFRVQDIAYDRWGGLPNAVRGASLLGLTQECRDGIAPPWPALVIGAGRRTAPVARWFKRKHGARLVQIMDPGWPGRADFDLIAVPQHDDCPDRPNLLRTMGSCHRAVPRLMEAERRIWEQRLAVLPRPYLALVVGGSTKDYAFGVGRARQLVAETRAMAGAMGASILATTSRRTDAEIEAILVESIPQPAHIHLWRRDTENPYMAFLSLADAIVVTGDSMNMCSEACANGGPVYVFAPPGMVNEKHARLHQMLYDRGYAKPLDAASTGLWSHPPLNAALDVAQAIRDKRLLG